MGDLRRLGALRGCVLLVLCVVYPLASYAQPAMGRAWAMYTSTTFYRLRLVGVRADGTTLALASEPMLSDASPRVASAIAGSERGRHGSALSLPSHLDLVARHACRPELHDVEATLEVRTLSSEQTDRFTVRIECPR